MKVKVGIGFVSGLLATSCDNTQGYEMPSQEELEACEDQSMGDTGFDWDCCDIWYRECMAEGRGEDECMWICNG